MEKQIPTIWSTLNHVPPKTILFRYIRQITANSSRLELQQN